MKLKSLTTILLFLLPVCVFSQVNAQQGIGNVPAQTDGTEAATTDKENKVLDLSHDDAI